MLLAADLVPAFGALALAVISLWLPVPPLRGQRDWAWCAGLLLACAAGKATGVLDASGLAATFLYLALAFGARASERAWIRMPLLVLTGLCAFGFALHRFPGFHNPVLAESVVVSPGAAPFTLHANFDTAVAGIVLMGVFCAPIRERGAWLPMLRRTVPVLAATLAVVLGTGWLSGYVRPDIKWMPLAPWFLAINLLFTCVTEEAFFRGFILGGLARGMALALRQRGRRGRVDAAVRPRARARRRGARRARDAGRPGLRGGLPAFGAHRRRDPDALRAERRPLHRVHLSGPVALDLQLL